MKRLFRCSFKGCVIFCTPCPLFDCGSSRRSSFTNTLTEYVIYHGFFITFRYEGDKLVCPKVVVASPIAAYENTVEVQSLEQLEDIISDPDEMRMQALLVRERILGPAHPDTSYYIRYRGAVYADMGHFERCITLWMYALDMQQKMLEPLSLMTQSSLLRYYLVTIEILSRSFP